MWSSHHAHAPGNKVTRRCIASPHGQLHTSPPQRQPSTHMRESSIALVMGDPYTSGAKKAKDVAIACISTAATTHRNAPSLAASVANGSGSLASAAAAASVSSVGGWAGVPEPPLPFLVFGGGAAAGAAAGGKIRLCCSAGGAGGGMSAASPGTTRSNMKPRRSKLYLREERDERGERGRGAERGERWRGMRGARVVRVVR